MQNEETHFRLKELTVYDRTPFVPEEKQKAIMEKAIAQHKKAVVTGK